MIRSVLVVCIGNICRSPLGERMLKSKLEELGSQIQVSSAGLYALVGHAADADASSVAQEHGVDMGGHAARQFTHELGSKADLILVMEPGHKTDLEGRAPGLSGKTMLFDQWTGAKGIADPYRRSRDFHEAVFQQVESAANAWVKKLAPKRP